MRMKLLTWCFGKNYHKSVVLGKHMSTLLLFVSCDVDDIYKSIAWVKICMPFFKAIKRIMNTRNLVLDCIYSTILRNKTHALNCDVKSGRYNFLKPRSRETLCPQSFYGDVKIILANEGIAFWLLLWVPASDGLYIIWMKWPFGCLWSGHSYTIIITLWRTITCRLVSR